MTESTSAYQLQILPCHQLLLQKAVNDIHGQKQCLWHELHRQMKFVSQNITVIAAIEKLSVSQQNHRICVIVAPEADLELEVHLH